MGKTSMAAAARGMVPAVLLVLCGCTPSFQQKLQKEQADENSYGTQSREHAAAERCSKVIPGSTEHMACMLSAAKSK
jgi:hypothetical protein